MKLGLEGKVAVVTGASKGIGAAIARELAGEGCSLALCARGEEDLSVLAGEIRSSSTVDVFSSPADVTDADQVIRFRDEVVTHFEKVDILINNAGRSYPGNFDTLTDEDFMNDYNVKSLSHIRVSRAFLPALRECDSGRIVNINSIHGHHADARFFTSSVNRAASIAFARTLALALAPEGICVNSVNIGYVLTPQWSNVHQRVRPDMEADEFFADMGSREVPMGRMGRPEEVAGIVTFLASERASYMTGASIDVGGGQ
ncbi:MAG TPA: SDR family oxidoreductase [Acidimicrobiia bacterium]|nr:SDR family oxidoreductase [Acidimicrobiia bacterium]